MSNSSLVQKITAVAADVELKGRGADRLRATLELNGRGLERLTNEQLDELGSLEEEFLQLGWWEDEDVKVNFMPALERLRAWLGSVPTD